MQSERENKSAVLLNGLDWIKVWFTQILQIMAVLLLIMVHLTP